MAVNWQEFVEVIQRHERFILTSHIRPDCDALGSVLGMMDILEQLGKDVMIVNGQPTPPNLSFIDPENRIQAIGVDVQLEDLQDRDIHMVLDTSAWAQLGSMGDVIKAMDIPLVVVDHHQGEDDLGQHFSRIPQPKPLENSWRMLPTHWESSGMLVWHDRCLLPLQQTQGGIDLDRPVRVLTNWRRVW